MAFVKSIATDAEFQTEINQDKLVVIDFTATWCGPCRAIKPLFSELAKKHNSSSFCTVDIDVLKETKARLQISAVPTFHFYKNGQLLDEVKGANPNALQAMIEKHSNAKESSSGNSYSDLNQFVNKNQVECLNITQSSVAANIFVNGSAGVESDVDEQIILVVPFNQVVKLHSLKFVAPVDFAPKQIKTFVNLPHALSFDDAETLEAVENLTLNWSEPEAGFVSCVTKLRYVKYQSVHSLTIFISGNVGSKEITKFKYLEFMGTPIEATKDMKELLKKE